MQGPLDIEKFVSEYERLGKSQEWQVQLAFLNQESSYQVCPEFVTAKVDFDCGFANKSERVKNKIQHS